VDAIMHYEKIKLMMSLRKLTKQAKISLAIMRGGIKLCAK